MTIADKIKNSIQAVHGNTFEVYYHDEPTLNLEADKMDLPCAVVQLITQGVLMFANGQIKESVTAAVFFVDISHFDFDSYENEEIIDQCKRRALQWVNALPMDEWISLSAVERTQRVYEQYDAILTGYGMLCRLTELEGVSDCPTDDENEEEI